MKARELWRRCGLIFAIAAAVGMYGATTGCMGDPPSTIADPPITDPSAPGDVDAVGLPITELCLACPLLHAMQARGEAVSSTCPTNCEACPDGVCNNDETHETCSPDCPAISLCGNGRCEGDEVVTCRRDCEPFCGNGRCESGETVTSCPQDCCGGAGCPEEPF